MDDNLVTLVAVVVGGLIAAAAGWWQAHLQRRWQLEDFERAQAAARNAEVRARADKKALEIQVELDILERLLIPRQLLVHYVRPKDPDDRAELRRAVERLARAAALMQMPVRRHVEVAAHILPDADELAWAWLHVHPRTVVWNVIGNAREAVNRYMRNDDVPDDLPEPVQGYVEAWEALQEDIGRQVERQAEQTQADTE